MTLRPSPAELMVLWTTAPSVPPCFSTTSLNLSDRERKTLRRVIDKLELVEPGLGADLLLHGRLERSPASVLNDFLRHCVQVNQPDDQTYEESDLLQRLFRIGIQHRLIENCPVPERDTLKRPRHLVTPDAINCSHHVIEWHQKFVGSFAGKARPLNDIERWGRFLFSLCVRNGVGSPKLLSALASASAQPILATMNLYYLEIVHQSHCRGRLSVRRVFLEPLTAILAIREGGLFSERKPPDPWKAIKTYFLTLSVKNVPRSLSAFVSACRGHYSLYLPAFIIPYIDGSIPSTSVPEPIFRRTLGIAPRPARVNHAYLEDVIAPANKKQEASSTLLGTARHFSEIAAATTDAQLREACLALERNAAQDAEIRRSASLAARWGLSMLDSEGKKLKSAVKKSLLSVGVALTEYLGDAEPGELEPDDLKELYESLSEDLIPRTDRSKRFRDLNALMIFLSKAVGLTPKTQWTEPPLPEAAYLTPLEVLEAIEIVGEPTRIRDHKERLLCQALLSGLTMGMRPSEWIKIYLRHFASDRIRLEFTPDRSLKSAASPRIVCMNLALPLAEDCIRKFAVARQQDEADQRFSHFLFAYKKSDSPYADHRIEDNIETAIRSVTCDSSTRLYHLRHSLASWLFLAVAAETCGIEAELRPLLGGMASVLDHQDRWMSVIAEYPNAKAAPLFSIARALGHSNFNVTREHYIHTFDVVLLALLMKSAFTVDWSLMIAASGMHRSSARQDRHEDGWELVRGVEKRNPHRVLREDTALQHRKTKKAVTNLFPTLLKYHEQMRSAIGGVTLPDFDRVQERANDLAQISSAKSGSPLKRHRMSWSAAGDPRPLDFADETVYSDARTACPYFELAIQKNPAELAWAVDQFAHGAQSKHNRVSFAHKNDAIRFLGVLTSMGFSEKQIQWGYGLTTAKKSLLTTDIPTKQRIWLAFAPLLNDRQHRQVAGWYWVWQMLAITHNRAHSS